MEKSIKTTPTEDDAKITFGKAVWKFNKVEMAAFHRGVHLGLAIGIAVAVFIYLGVHG